MIDEPVTGLIISDEAQADARAIVGQHVALLPSGRCVLDSVLVEQLTEAIAAALQGHMNCAELAEAERKQAVHAATALRQRVLEAASRTHVESWATCPRCHVRAPSVMELRHQAGCRLSSHPPPRRSVPPNSGGED